MFSEGNVGLCSLPLSLFCFLTDEESSFASPHTPAVMRSFATGKSKKAK
jgi:hypothetical protein